MTPGKFSPTTRPHAAVTLATGATKWLSSLSWRSWQRPLVLAALMPWLAVGVRAQPVLNTLASLSYFPNGASPYATLTPGAGGGLYGSAYFGGTNGVYGTMFQVTTNGVLTTLLSFDSANGAFPYAALVAGGDGNLYGTTVGGGANDDGTVYELATNGGLTTVATFGGTNGTRPFAGLTLGADGNFYGTTSGGGTNGGYGTVFQLGTNGMLTSLASFNFTNGAEPYANLAAGPDGAFYGTTYIGGTNGGYGTVFRVTTNGCLTTLTAFDYTNGAYPYAALTADANGGFYGTTRDGGTNGGYGTIFHVTTNGTLTTLVAFNRTNGAAPYAGLTWGADGNLYGATTEGGANGYGTLFVLATNGVFATLATFNDTNNGASPYGNLTPGAGGIFYGTTSNGGTNGGGTVFALDIGIPQAIGVYNAAMTNGQFLFTISNCVPAAGYSVVSATNLDTPGSDWQAVAASPKLPTGGYQFAIPVNTNETRRFYRVQPESQ